MSSTTISQLTKITEKIQRADYEGDRETLKLLFSELESYANVPEVASRVLYWRGFAMWRSAINGFNDDAPPGELEDSLTQALQQFEDSLRTDRVFIEAKIGLASSTGLLAYLQMGNNPRARELVSRTLALLKEIQTVSPDNPHYLWVVGQIQWNSTPESGGQQKAIDGYKRGLEVLGAAGKDSTGPLEPAWGRPELLMSLAWSSLNLANPDLSSAEIYAFQALELIPYWHYVRDILLPQINAAKENHP